ncbi:ABC transporter-like protein [Salinisphaera sp. PC39]|uniref:ABC transporter ATP-binding protein n=1 Tax=Salinisphaera sp. PC39 TaxID=1304156 RepID=UPI003340D905
MSDEPLVSARGLHRRYGVKTAVAGVDLTLRQGEILGLLGPNGAGKTTTLRMLSGSLAPTSGSVRICGHDMAEAPARAKGRLGYLPERPPLYPELTVDEYLGFCARLHGVPRARRRDAVASAKDDCGLADTGRRVIGNLSKGYQQRVGIAQAILHRPDVVILDEPTVGLDPNQIREIRGLIARLGEHHSVLLSSHILPEIQATCSRVMIIHGGRVVFNRPMAEIEGDRLPELVDVGLHADVTRDDLAAIDGVAAVQDLGNGRWRLECRSGVDIRERVAATAAERGWRLYELSAARRTLEGIFAELTSREPEPIREEAA